MQKLQGAVVVVPSQPLCPDEESVQKDLMTQSSDRLSELGQGPTFPCFWKNCPLMEEKVRGSPRPETMGYRVLGVFQKAPSIP